MSNLVTVVDYNAGNLFSLSQAIRYCGFDVVLAQSGKEIKNADKLILPGVGAFGYAMDELRNRDLVEPILEYCTRERPFLGICVGMQIMADLGEEFGYHKGLGLIPGHVGAIPGTGSDGVPHKIPHIGWNSLLLPEGRTGWNQTIMETVTSGDYVYFVHSYAIQPDMPQHRLADCNYDGQVITAAIQKDHLHGCQFHPEKSGKVGLKILSRFLTS